MSLGVRQFFSTQDHVPLHSSTIHGVVVTPFLSSENSLSQGDHWAVFSGLLRRLHAPRPTGDCCGTVRGLRSQPPFLLEFCLDIHLPSPFPQRPFHLWFAFTGLPLFHCVCSFIFWPLCTWILDGELLSVGEMSMRPEVVKALQSHL